MTDLMAARMTMGFSLGFHIILASIGMVMPFLLAASHWLWLKTKEDTYYRLTKAWSRGVAIFFATGAVSGTALSFELGVLWPGFMEHAGPIIGMPFSLEGAAFFVEAIALGLYLYGWKKMPPLLHWGCSVIVGIAGMASGILVIAANGWMNAPTGFDWVDGAAVNIDPWAAMFNDAWFTQAGHMAIAAIEAVGFAVVGVHAYLARRSDDPIHKAAMKIALVFAATAALVQPLHGHMTAQDVAERQPVKLAAMEAHFETESRAGLLIGGIPDEESQTVSYGVKIPGLLSFIAFDDINAEVQGLDQTPKENWPPVAVVHFAFQIMVAIGTFLALVSIINLWGWRRRRDEWFDDPRVLKLLIVCLPLGFIAIEAGWIVTEVGRQPWIVYELIRTEQALTPVPGQIFHFLAFTSLYTFIGFSTAWMWRQQIRNAKKLPTPDEETLRWVNR